MTADTSRARRGGGRSEKSTDEFSTVFPSVAPSAASARRFVADDFIELVLLLTSELVTNAYRHAGTETRVSVRLDDDCTRVEVRDVGRGEPELRPLDTDRVDGRGLQIVDALADRWGYHSNAGGTAVWFELVHRR